MSPSNDGLRARFTELPSLAFADAADFAVVGNVFRDQLARAPAVLVCAGGAIAQTALQLRGARHIDLEATLARRDIALLRDHRIAAIARP